MAGVILGFFATVWLLLRFLQRKPSSAFTQIALTWFGPVPVPGQSWAFFQLRWAAYSFRCFVLFAIAFCAMWALVSRAPETYSYTLFQFFWFALPLGLGMALLASLGFLAKAAKARYLGPNPVFTPPNMDVEA